MTSHIESFLSGAFAQVQSRFFGVGVVGDGDLDLELTDAAFTDRLLSGGGDGASCGGATHIAYEDLFASIVFLACVYVMGQVASRLLRMPALVGEIFAGILLGPNLAAYVPFPVTFVTLGEIGLILLVIEAGIDIDLTTLKLIGSRGLVIAIVGSILPIAIAVAIAFAIGTDVAGSIAAGACFGPTSLGIAMNILRQGKIVNTPVGQLIVSAAVIDDMIALIILSQLGALAGDATVATVAVPIVSALCYLILGGAAAVTVIPSVLDKHVFPRVNEGNRGAAGLGLMFLILFAMMPATYYAKSSFLMGAFLSGLVFCRNHDVHARFASQFKRLLQWLMRIFFAASIGFQVPVKDFGSGKVIGFGLLFTLALTGKLAVGFLVPNFNNSEKFKGLHLRDCLITGCSMAAEGEFAFVIAVFAKDQDLIDADLYASIVLAVLISTIIPPFALRFTVSYYNKIAEGMIRQAEELERMRAATIEEGVELTPGEQEERLRANIEANKIVFLCIQIQCGSTWGLIPKIISTLTSLHLEVIDNRSWHPRGVDSTLMTEIFVQDDNFLNLQDGEEQGATIEERIAEVSGAMDKAIRQPGAKVKVTRWFPGVLQAIVEEVKSRSSVSKNLTLAGGGDGGTTSVRDILAKEATKTLEGKRNMQIAATREKTLVEIKRGMGIPLESASAQDGGAKATGAAADAAAAPAAAPAARAHRRVRQKMRSTPVVGGSLFDDPKPPEPLGEPDVSPEGVTRAGRLFPVGGLGGVPGGQSAELVVGGESFVIRVMPETVHRIRSGYSGELLDDASVKFSQGDVPVEHRLQGFVRTAGLQTISEDVSETASNHGSDRESEKDDW